jgi:hypothetical protein
MKMEQTECSEMLAYKIQTPGNYPEESMPHSERGQSLKSRMYLSTCTCCCAGTVQEIMIRYIPELIVRDLSRRHYLLTYSM